MTRRWLKLHLPDSATLQSQLSQSHSVLGRRFAHALKALLADPQLWHLNRHTVAGGVAVGLFISWIPIPLQMILAAVIAAMLRVHVPVSVVMVWFTNPLTLAPLCYAAFRVGSTLIGTRSLDEPLTMTLQGLQQGWIHAWPALLAGSLFLACLTATGGFLLTHLIWRFNTIRRWRKRNLH